MAANESHLDKCISTSIYLSSFMLVIMALFSTRNSRHFIAIS